MKTIDLKEAGQIKTKDIIALVIGNAPPGSAGVRPAEMRQRVRILDALEGANGELKLEDADYGLLKTTVEQFPFAVANKDLLAVLDGILEPKS